MMLITFLNLFLIAKCYKLKNALIWALCLLSLIVFCGTEGMSFFHVLTPLTARFFWGSLALCLSVFSFVLYRKKKLEICYLFKKEDIFKFLFFVWIIILGVVALLIVPNNADSMIYHLSRIEHWIHNSSVSYFETNTPQQIYSPVLAEYFILQTFLLYKTDIFSNLIQFFSYVFSALLMFEIMGKLKFSSFLKVVATLFFLSVPMAIAQSVTSQNDLASVLWLLVFVSLMLDLKEIKKLSFNKECLSLILLISFSVSFAFLTKSHICFPLFVLMIFGGFHFLKKKENYPYFLPFALIGGLIFCLLTGMTFYRNFISSGDIFASVYMGKVAVGTFHPLYLLINALKNMALLLANPILPAYPANWVIGLSDILGVDVNHEVISWTKNFAPEIIFTSTSFSHDFVSSSFITFLFVISVVCYLLFLLLFFKKTPNKGLMATFLIAIFISLIVLRYQSWGCRLLLPSSCLMILFVACLLNALQQITKKKCYILLIYLSVFSLFPAYLTFLHQTKFIDRGNKIEKYFSSYPIFYRPYFKIAEMVKLLDAKKVGIWGEGDIFDYPLLKMLENVEVKHILLEKNNDSFSPDVIMVFGKNDNKENLITYNDQEYKPVYFFENHTKYVIYLKKDHPLLLKGLFFKGEKNDLFSSSTFIETSAGLVVNSVKTPSVVIRTEYIKNAFDLKKGIDIYLTIESIQSPIKMRVFKNDTFLKEILVDGTDFVLFEKVFVNEWENEFILRFDLDIPKEKDAFGHIAIKNFIIKEHQKKEK